MSENINNERDIAVATSRELVLFAASKNSFNDFDFLFGDLIIDEDRGEIAR